MMKMRKSIIFAFTALFLVSAVTFLSNMNIQVQVGANSLEEFLPGDRDSVHNKEVLLLVHGFKDNPSNMNDIYLYLRGASRNYDQIIYYDLYKEEGETTEFARLFSGDYNIYDTTIGPESAGDIDDISFAKRLYDDLQSLLTPSPTAEGNYIDIVAHSMGGLVVRSMIKNFAKSNVIVGFKIDSVILLSTPNHGTRLAKLVTSIICPAVSVSNDIKKMAELINIDLEDLAKEVIKDAFPVIGDAYINIFWDGLKDVFDNQIFQMSPSSDFLDYLNSDDETPYYITWVTARGASNLDGNWDLNIDFDLKIPKVWDSSVSIDVDFPHYTDIVWSDIDWVRHVWEIRVDYYLKTLKHDIVYYTPRFVEIANDGIVETSSISLDGAINRYYSSWNHSDTMKWLGIGTEYNYIRTSIATYAKTRD